MIPCGRVPGAHDTLRVVLGSGDSSLTSSRLPRAAVTLGNPTALDTAADVVVVVTTALP